MFYATASRLGSLSTRSVSIFSRARPSRRRQEKAAPQGERSYCCFERRFRFALRRPYLFGAVSKACLLYIDNPYYER